MQVSRRPLLLGALAAALPGAALAQSAEWLGDWFGALELGATRLRLRLAIAAGPNVILYSVDQGNAAIPASEARINGARITLTFPSISASFEGELRDGRIAGNFTQGQRMPLTFAREQAAAPVIEPLTQEALAARLQSIGAMGMGAAGSNRAGRTMGWFAGLRVAGGPPITLNDKWHLGSITKSMTATLVARCAEAGLVSWDDTLGSVLGAAVPDMRAEYREVNLRHLCSHRAGLPGNLDLQVFASFPRESADARADRVRYAQLALAAAPVGPKEATFLYSNSGFVLAGAMLEARLGAPWEALIRERLFAPLGMNEAAFGAPGTPGLNDQPVGHAMAGPGGAMMAFPPGQPITDNPAVLGPAGRVHAPFADVLKYLDAHRDCTAFLSPASWDLLHTPPFGGDYAMGWMKRADNALWHNGSNTLWYAEVLVEPARGISAVAAVNDGRMQQMMQPVGATLHSAAQAMAS